MVGVGSLAGYIGEAMDGPPFSLAFVMVKESFVVPAIFSGGRTSRNIIKLFKTVKVETST